MRAVRSSSNVVYQCTYRVVWCSKYRRPVLIDDVAARAQEIIHQVCVERDAPIHELEAVADHVTLLVTVDPQYGIHRLVRQIKSRSSRRLREEFPSLRSRLPTLWTTSYFVATVGGSPSKMVDQYIAAQRNV